MEEILYSPTELNTPKQKDEFIRYTIEDYSKKSTHREQSDLPKRCFSIVIDINKSIFIEIIKNWRQADALLIQTKKEDNYKKSEQLLTEAIYQLISQYPLSCYINIETTIQQAQQKSIKTNKPSFIEVSFLGHSFCFSIFKDKICIIDSLDSSNGVMFEQLLKEINKIKKLNFNIKRINTQQQSDNVSCPYLAVFNTTKLDKWFQEDIGNFDKLFNEEELPLSLIASTQSITRIQNRLGINIKQLNKEGDLEVKFKTETKPQKLFNTKKPKQQIEKLIKYITYNTQTNKLQNHRVSKKSQDMLIKFLEANKDFTQQEEVIQSPVKQ